MPARDSFQRRHSGSPRSKRAPSSTCHGPAHAVRHRHLVAVLQVAADARQVDAHGDAVRAAARAAGPMPDSISSCGVLKAPPQRITSRRARTSRRSPGASLGCGMRAVEPLALQVLDAARRAVGVEQHARGQRVELDVQPVADARAATSQQPLARADAAVAARRQRRVAQALEAAAAPAAARSGRRRRAASAARSPAASAGCATKARGRAATTVAPARRRRAPRAGSTSRCAASRPSRARSDRCRCGAARATPARWRQSSTRRA